jgi:hypothetical protein
MLTLQLAAEERAGFAMRERERMVRELEEAALAKAAGVAREIGV